MAIEEYTKSIELAPQLAEAYYNRGVTYHTKGNLDLAIADYDQAIELDPQLAKAYYNRGVTYHTKGDLGRAISDLERALELGLDPKNMQVLEELLEDLR